MNNIKIYKFDGLSHLKQNIEYDRYIIICVGEDRGVWYQFMEQTESDSYKPYFKEKLGITDPIELQSLLDAFNEAVSNKSYDKLTAVKIRNNKYSDSATTEEGIVLTTKMSKDCRGMIWYKKGGKK